MRPEDQLNQGFARLHPVEFARQLECYEPEDAAEILTPLAPEDLGVMLGCCQPGVVSRLIPMLPLDKTTEVMKELPVSTAFVVFRQLTPEIQNHVVSHLGPVEGIRFRRAVMQPEQTAGSLADPRVLTLPPDISVAEAIVLLKRNPRLAGYYTYVVGREAKLEGVVSLKTLILADPEDHIATIMTDQVVAISSHLTNDEIIGHPHWQHYPTLPVVADDDLFLGMLRYRTLQRVIEDAATRMIPGSLPTALMQLWEAYSLVGLRVMTQLSGVTESEVASGDSNNGEGH